MRSLNKQLGEAEADYLTGTDRLAALRREVRLRGGVRVLVVKGSGLG